MTGNLHPIQMEVNMVFRLGSSSLGVQGRDPPGDACISFIPAVSATNEDTISAPGAGSI